MDAYDLSLLIYNLSLIPVIFFSVVFVILLIIRLVIKSPEKLTAVTGDDVPYVSVQIPTFNDPIATRCVEKCLAFDYPDDRYEIIIVDDSTNPDTQVLLKGYEREEGPRVKYLHRTNRVGYKPGALKDAMEHTSGEIIAIFDSDWIPKKDFLRKIVEPFKDPKVAIVQTRQGFYNHKTNFVTRFAAYLLMIFHSVILPITNRINCVFFCGTAGAIRRSAFDEVGGWNAASITEDSELSVKLILKGYKTTYFDYETPSEVPDTFEGFIKQQMRWCYGQARVFYDNYRHILFGKGLNLRQRVMLTMMMQWNVVALMIVVMTVFGFAGWLLGEPRLMTVGDGMTMTARLLITGGFLLGGVYTLRQRKQFNEFWHFLYGTFTMGLILAFSNAYAFGKAMLNKPLSWFCTPKVRNTDVVDDD